jgi:hypothetical protein
MLKKTKLPSNNQQINFMVRMVLILKKIRAN